MMHVLLFLLAFILVIATIAITGSVTVWNAIPFIAFAVLAFISHRRAMERDGAE